MAHVVGCLVWLCLALHGHKFFVYYDVVERIEFRRCCNLSLAEGQQPGTTSRPCDTLQP